jgi:HPt (histidine-containing phosphotransfer) domain-containing protein
MAGDLTLFRDMAKFLADDGRRLLERIEECLAAKQPRETERAAHTLKGLVSMFGAARAEQQALEMELAARNRDWEVMRGMMPELQRAVDEVIASVENYLAKVKE